MSAKSKRPGQDKVKTRQVLKEETKINAETKDQKTLKSQMNSIKYPGLPENRQSVAF